MILAEPIASRERQQAAPACDNNLQDRRQCKNPEQ
jgi:hypothetical protein